MMLDRPTLRRTFQVLGLAIAVGVVAYGSIMLPRETGRVAPIWLANAMVLATLLRTPPRTWSAWLTAGLAGTAAATFLASDSLAAVVALPVLNMVEALAAALLLRRAAPEGWNPGEPRHLTALRNTSVLVGMGSAICATLFFQLRGEGQPLSNLVVWALADALGLFLLTPCLLILTEWRRHVAARPFTGQGVATLATLAIVNAVVFSQGQAPIMFLVFPAMMAVGMTLELLGVAIAILMTGVMAISLTLGGQGPIALVQTGWTEKLLLQQLFLTVTLGLSLQMAVTYRQQREATDALEAARLAAEARTRRSQAARARYEAFAAQAKDVLSRGTGDGRLQWISPSIEVVTGYPPETYIGKRMIEFVVDEDRAAVVQAYRDLLRGRRAAGMAVRYRTRRKDGQIIWLESNPTVVRDDNGEAAFIDVARDVTDKVELQQELAEARAQAEQAVTVKAEFLANMSHEIRTPLTSILGFASLLSERNLGGEEGRYVARVESASRSLLALVNDVLDFSKLEAGALEVKPRPTDPAACGAEVVELFAPQGLAKGVTVTFEALTPAGQALVDPDRLRQVLVNLVGNAVKFTAVGEVRVTGAYDGARLRFEVRDTGPGMDAEAREKLFRRFSQVDASTTRAHGGTGLGLAISRGLIEAMDGEIGVESAPGEGSTFWFEIPALACARPAAAIVGGLDLDGLVGLRVLAVDDNPANLELVSSLLRPLGVEVTTAGGGVDGVKAAQEAPFDIILMDLRMPGVDGFAAAQAIRQTAGPNSHGPILAFSADITADRGEIFEVFQDAVTKPLELAQLLAAILRWTGPEGWEEASEEEAAGGAGH